MKQNQQKIAGMYDTIAAKWAMHFLGEHEKKPLDQVVLHRFAKKLKKTNMVWDCGCGTGETAGYLKKLGLRVSGLDLSEKMLEQARLHHPDIPFRAGNILALEFHDNGIDAIVAFYAIIHFSKNELHKAFSEFFRVLRPGGLLLLAYHVGEEVIYIREFLGEQVDMDCILFSKDAIHDGLSSAGFTKIETIEREPYPDVEYQSRRAYVFAQKPALFK